MNVPTENLPVGAGMGEKGQLSNCAQTDCTAHNKKKPKTPNPMRK
jgi:hypothetical protein